MKKLTNRVGGGHEGAWILALLACLMVTPMATAQFGPMSASAPACSPPPCPGGLPVRDPEELWYPVPANPEVWVDRRPTAEIRLGNGDWDHSDRGQLDQWWDGNYPSTPPICTDTSRDDHDDFDVESNTFSGGDNGRPDQFDWLLAQLQDRYDRGYRRIVLFMPAGWVVCQDFAASQWWPMAQWRRDWFEAVGSGASQGVAGWINQHPDAEVGLYMGWQIGDPCSICHKSNTAVGDCDPETYLCGNPPEPVTALWFRCPAPYATHVPDTTDEADMCTVWRNVAPWRSIGIRRVWLDASSGAASNYSDAFRNFVYNPVFWDANPPFMFGGEAFPYDDGTIPGDQRYEVTWSEFAYEAFVISLTWAEHPQNNGPWCQPGNPTSAAHQWDLRGLGGIREAAVFPIDYPPLCNGNPVAGWGTGGERLDTLYEHYICKGFTLWQGGANEFSGAAERIFGFGKIKPARDFDGDGSWTSADLTRFQTQFGLWHDENCTHYQSGFMLTYYHGDVTGDGCVTWADWTAFNTLWIDPPIDDTVWLGNPDTHEMTWDPKERWLPCLDGGGSSSMGP